MRINSAKYQFIILLAMLALVAVACQRRAPVPIKDIPIPAGATVLSQNDSEINPTVKAALEQDAVYRNTTKTDHISYKAFRFSPDPQYRNGLNVYQDELKAAGWSSGWGWEPTWQVYDNSGGQTLILHLLDDHTGLLTLDE